MKTLVLLSAVAALGFVGCSHPQQATRPAANALPYHEPGHRAWSPHHTEPEPAATGGSGVEEPASPPSSPDAQP